MSDAVLTVDEAAKYLGVAAKTIRRQIAAGHLPAYRLGGRLIRIYATDLDALLTPIQSDKATS